MPGQAGEYSHDKRDETMTPLHGRHRQQLPPTGKYKNPLLVKPTLGNVKATCYDLPSVPGKNGLQHEYGLRQVRDGCTSNDVLGNWAENDPSGRELAGRDFKALNKHAAVEGVTNCKTMKDYRSTHDFKLKLGSDKVKEVKPYDQNTSFGRPTNASSNFTDLFSHGYRYDWCAEAPPAEVANKQAASKKPTMTKTALAQQAAAKAKMNPPEEVPLWKMGTFATVPPKVGHTG